jgi:hypothetical protein
MTTLPLIKISNHIVCTYQRKSALSAGRDASGDWLSVISYLLSARSRSFDPARNWRVGSMGE